MRIVIALLILTTTAFAHASATEDTYPSRPITLVAPFAPGGSVDLVARIVSEGLRVKLNSTVVVENRGGGTGVIGTREVVKAEPDGHTLLIGSLGGQVLPALMTKNFPFDPLRDFVPVSMTAEWFPVMCVRSDLPVSNLQEFIAYAKARPGKLNFGSSGYGSLVHLVAEVLMKETGVRMQQVPYKSGTTSVADPLSGALDVVFTSSAVGVGQASNKDIKMLAVAGTKRVTLLPNVPTMEEAGVKGVDQTAWIGVLGPPGLAEPIRAKLSRALVESVQDPSAQARIRSIGFEPVGSDAATFDTFFRAEVKRWTDFVTERGLLPKG